MRKRVPGQRLAAFARPGAIFALAALAAGCSADVARFDDGFYTGAVPQSVPGNQMAANGTVDGMRTGSVNAYPAAGYADAAPAGAVTSSQLPPPGGYSSGGAYGSNAAGAPQAADANRGTPPSTLNDQAARMGGQSGASAPSQSASASGSSVTVESGDTLSSISRRTGVSVADLRRINGIEGDRIRLGQSLQLPSGTTVAERAPTQTASVDTGTATDASPAPSPAASAPATESAQAAAPAQASSGEARSGRVTASASPAEASAPASSVEAESRDVASIAPESTGISQFRWPVQGRVVNRFGERVDGRRNDGLNISVPRGTSVRAAENGVVIYSGDGLKEFGNTVLVKHDNGLVTVYGHADELKVKRGEQVRRGQEIASSGMSGNTSVPMLHFEVRKDSTPVDPTSFLN